MNATIETMPEMKVATVHHVGPYNQIGEAFARLGPLAGGLIGAPGTMMVGIYHDDPESVPAAELRSDAGLVVPATANVPAGLDTTTIPAGRYAKAIHKGPYERLGDSWAQLMGVWIPQHDERIARDRVVRGLSQHADGREARRARHRALRPARVAQVNSLVIHFSIRWTFGVYGG